MTFIKYSWSCLAHSLTISLSQEYVWKQLGFCIKQPYWGQFYYSELSVKELHHIQLETPFTHNSSNDFSNHRTRKYKEPFCRYKYFFNMFHQGVIIWVWTFYLMHRNDEFHYFSATYLLTKFSNDVKCFAHFFSSNRF